MNKKKSITIIFLTGLLVAVMIIGTTLAYFTHSDTVTNTFTIGDIRIDIDEPHWKEYDSNTNTPGSGEGLTPGDTKVKDPVITALVGDSYMRLIMTITDQLTGTIITDPTRLAQIFNTLYYDRTYNYVAGFGNSLVNGAPYSLSDIAATGCTHVNEVDFELDAVRSNNNAGQYIYNYKNSSTNDVFKYNNKVVFMSHVIIPEDWVQADLNLLGKYQITFRVEAIQASHFSSAAEAFAALDVEVVALRQPVQVSPPVQAAQIVQPLLVENKEVPDNPVVDEENVGDPDENTPDNPTSDEENSDDPDENIPENPAADEENSDDPDKNTSDNQANDGEYSGDLDENTSDNQPNDGEYSNDPDESTPDNQPSNQDLGNLDE